ncbi:hypothetical protein RDWZM_003109 [Blomia tropicalis]|uniref:Cytochrome c oxidase assembly factor 3 n=1 Tax=Blomia tropicalis TaxID=40697 RepID=A0A9Q0MEZ7_BLOTA|nr:Cytochrome c oxidase assembly factor 3, mitochondrial [Blomia tropicalis]KAJ6224564.1 hypothetical protein RDWZM_003109 [Blomia tropicalis]
MSSKPAINEDVQQTFIRKAQKREQEKFNKVNMIRARNRFSGLFMAAVVGSIYAYTLLAVKQEKFLDELDEPETPNK